MLNINEAVNVVKRQFSSLISVIKNTTFDSRITNLDEIPVAKFPAIQSVTVIGDTTSEILEDLNTTLSNHLVDIKNKIEPTEIDFTSIIKKLDTLKDPNINKGIEKLLTTISKKEVSFKSLEKQLASIEDTFKEHYNKKKDKKIELDYTIKFDEIKNVLSNIYIPTAPRTVGLSNKASTRINPATEDKQDDLITGQETALEEIKKLVGFEIAPYDYIDLSYTGDDLTGVVYKDGGSGGTTVATLTLAYTANILQSVTKS